MSLCFKWSCDFHRFTKSKTLRISGSHYTQFPKKPSQAFSLFNLQGTIRCFRGLFRTFWRSLSFSVAAYLLYQIVFNLSRTFFVSFQLFSTRAALFQKQLIYFTKLTHICQELFSFDIWYLFGKSLVRVTYLVYATNLHLSTPSYNKICRQF